MSYLLLLSFLPRRRRSVDTFTKKVPIRKGKQLKYIRVKYNVFYNSACSRPCQVGLAEQGLARSAYIAVGANVNWRVDRLGPILVCWGRHGFEMLILIDSVAHTVVFGRGSFSRESL